MLEIRKSAISLEEEEVMELERIVLDSDQQEALGFLRKCVYERILRSQQGRLRSHLESANPVEGFLKNQ
jgi:hypothetical protein